MLDKPLFKSRRFISALIGLVMMVLVAYVPDLQPIEAVLVESITQVVLALIAGYSLSEVLTLFVKK
jgi:hypothetical protein